MKTSRRTRIVQIAAALFICLAGALAALDWPLSPPRLSATFGTPAGTPAAGRMVFGLSLASDNGIVHASEEGELSFHLEEGRHPGGLPTPLGSFVVVEHGKGLAAVYAHLAPGTVSDYLEKVSSSAILGRAGSSGWAEGSGVFFAVFDRREGGWVNPLLVLPPLADDKPPLIRSLALSRGGTTYILGAASKLPQGTYVISADVVDPADSSWLVGPFAPYSIRLAVDGVEISRKVFDVARGAKGDLVFFSNGGGVMSELRSPEGRWILAERQFARGRVSLELRVEDAAGNKRSSTWTISIE